MPREETKDALPYRRHRHGLQSCLARHGRSLRISGLASVARTQPGWNGTRIPGPFGLARKVSENPDAASYMSSPVIYRDFLVGLSHKRRGQFVCLDTRTGVTAWSSAGRDAENAAVLVAGDKVLFLIDTGELIVADPAAKAFTPVRRYAVAKSATWAHPAVAAKVILVKDSDSLSACSAE
jgi:hypothetical protein